MNAFIFQGQYFDILGYQRGSAETLYVYIEGDGKAWLNRRRPSDNPTPDNPIGLNLAVEDTHEAVLYLSRPCQFVDGDMLRNCGIPLWTSARFSEPVIKDMSYALDQAKQLAGAKRVKIAGYSGGGAIALLLAARRDDVDTVVTIAGNIDHAAWTRYHGVSPLRYSLNPVDSLDRLQKVSQLHIVSADDGVVPPVIVQNFVSQVGDASHIQVVIIEDISHTGEWSAVVPNILEKSAVW